LRALPGILVSLSALVALIYFIDIGEVKNDLLQADYRYLILVLALYVLALMTRAIAWRKLLLDEIPYRDVFFTLNAGYLLNNILPLRLGELGRGLILGRHGLGFWRVLSTILVERVFDFAIISGMLLTTLPFITGASQANKVAITVFCMVLIGFVIFYLIARYRERVLILYELLTERWPGLSLIGEDRLRSFITGLAALTDLCRFLSVLFWMLVNWGLAILAQYLLLLAFVPSAELIWIVFGLAVVALGVALPSAPAYIGILEAAWVAALSLVGVEPSTALAFAVSSHLINITVTGVFGVYALVREGESLVRLYSKIRKE
jgi:uncharacterized protein (TIRG00374 family)